MYAEDSINLLKRSGINFEKCETEGMWVVVYCPACALYRASIGQCSEATGPVDSRLPARGRSIVT